LLAACWLAGVLPAVGGRAQTSQRLIEAPGKLAF